MLHPNVFKEYLTELTKLFHKQVETVFFSLIIETKGDKDSTKFPIQMERKKLMKAFCWVPSTYFRRRPFDMKIKK